MYSFKILQLVNDSFRSNFLDQIFWDSYLSHILEAWIDYCCVINKGNCVNNILNKAVHKFRNHIVIGRALRVPGGRPPLGRLLVDFASFAWLFLGLKIQKTNTDLNSKTKIETWMKKKRITNKHTFKLNTNVNCELYINRATKYIVLIQFNYVSWC